MFPTGGYHWPGMGADIDAGPRRAILDRVQSAIEPLGVPAGALRRLMAGADQARRDRGPAGWTWSGDFPLSMVAQMALGFALAEAFIERRGAPCLLAGESMGELAAYCVAGALPLEDAARLTYRWAHDLEMASATLDLRMAVVEDLSEEAFATFAESQQAGIVVTEAPHLFVVALPPANLPALDREVTRRGGHVLVSNNPCAAHEPRLAGAARIWSEHERFLEDLPFAAPRIPLLSTLRPAEPLADPAALRQNRVDTTFHRVRWGETLAALLGLGVRQVILFGPTSSGYALKKLRGEDARLAPLRIAVIGTLEGLARATGTRS